MEGYGFSAAVWQSAGSHRHLVMKAICDRADRDKTQDWQPYAAAVAARYARHFLRDRPLEPHAPREKAGGARGTTATLNHPRPAASELQASEDPSTHLPPKAYHELIGRQSEIGRITRALQGSQDVIVVVGLGGIGKTALVREVAARCLEHQSFKGIVWTSFKSELFVGERVTEIERLEFSFDEVLGEILRQHAAQIREDDKKRQKPGADISALTTDQRLTAVTQALKKHRILIVLDNLETVPDGEELVARLSAISGHGKLLITSRHKLKLDAFNLELSGLTEQEGVAFLRKESQARGIEAVSGATRSALVTIHHVTGGAPLAMKLVIGQMSRQPMVAVLETLKSATFRGEDYEFYSFIYRYSWQNLEQPARMALVDMSVFADKGGAIEDVQSISQVKGDDFWRAMDQLVRLSLVEKTGKAGAERFALHPLTKNFVRSDITKEWGRGKEHASRR
jgi:hypothetical protein